MSQYRILVVLLAWLTLGMVQVQRATAQVVTGEVIRVGLDGIGRSGGSLGGSGAGVWGWYRQGHWIPVHVKLENHSGKRWKGYLATEQVDLDGDVIRSVGRQFVLEPTLEARDLWLYCWPRPDDENYPIKSILVLDENKQEVTALPVAGAPQAVRGKGGYDMHGERWVVVVGPNRMGWDSYVGSKGGVASNRISLVTTAAEFPDQALGLDGVDVIVWEAGQEQVKPGDMGFDLRIRAMLEWVKAGGHLIITSSSPAELNENKELAAALPMELQSTRQVSVMGLLSTFSRNLIWSTDNLAVQMLGKVKVVGGAKAEHGGDGGGGRIIRGVGYDTTDAPLVVTGTYGQGAITLVTIDLATPHAAFRQISDKNWLAFWQQAAGWAGPTGYSPALMTEEEYKTLLKTEKNPENAPTVDLDTGLTNAVDLSQQSGFRLLLAVLFLGLYWLAAGPGADLLLRKYRRAVWTWWIFGASVITASGLALLVVWVFRLESQELKHRTFVSGTVSVMDGTYGGGQPDNVSVTAYYGLYVPTDRTVTVALPGTGGTGGAGGGGKFPMETQGNGGGQLAHKLNYLVPLTNPSTADVKGFADQKSYDLSSESPTQLKVPFRSTLKKLQARWTGSGLCRVEAFNVRAAWSRSDGEGGGVRRGGVVAPEATGTRGTLTGKLVNRTGYNLTQVRLIVLSPERDYGAQGAVFAVNSWADGETLELSRLQPERDSLGKILLEAFGVPKGETPGMGWMRLKQNRPDGYDLIRTMLDFRGGESWDQDPIRTEFTRNLTRTVDRSAALRAGRMMILASAGSSGVQEAELEPDRYGRPIPQPIPPSKAGVKAPLPLLVDGKPEAGSGEINFSWILNLP